MRVLLTEDADADLLQIHAYIAERNPAVAISLAHDFEQKIRESVAVSLHRPRTLQSFERYSQRCCRELRDLLSNRT